jgi:hypothetical protein
MTQERLTFCACGCGLAVPAPTRKRNRPSARFVKGHNCGLPEFVRLTLTPENLKRRGESIKASWERDPLIRPTGMRRAWREGKFDNKKYNTPKCLIAQKNNCAKARARITGSHGFGRGRRDNPNHCSAKAWVIRSPQGITFETQNLLSWCRSNANLFVEHTPAAKSPIWLRAFGGLGKQHCGLAPRKQWFGWVLVSVVEQACGAPDLIARQDAQLAPDFTAQPQPPSRRTSGGG